MTEEGEVLARLAAVAPEHREEALFILPPGLRTWLMQDWGSWAHAGQVAPPGDWRVWLIRAGRGFGKTRAGAEWVAAYARENAKARIALVGDTAGEVRKIMIEGASGLIAVAGATDKVEWRASAGEVAFGSGAKAYVYSANAPEALRGPEHHIAWCDELAKWRYGDAAWDNLMLGLRIGDRPRALVTTTPRPTMLMRRVMALPDCIETRGGTRDNPYLPTSFVRDMEARYGGSRLGRQELDGELIEDIEAALWTRDLIERQRVAKPPELVRVVIGVDPPATAEGDACGIVAVALGRDGHGYVVADASVRGLGPEGWARAVADCAATWEADRVVAEVNQGGDMVESVLRAADAGMPVTKVRAARGKVARAEPVAALYAAGRMFHAGAFPALEDELAGLAVGGGYQGPGRSPDRADALVWAATFLMLGGRSGEVGLRVV